MDISSRARGEVIILDISGEIDLYNAPEIKDIVNKLIEQKKYNLIINLKEVTYIDSSGIGAVLRTQGRRSRYGSGSRGLREEGNPLRDCPQERWAVCAD